MVYGVGSKRVVVDVIRLVFSRRLVQRVGMLVTPLMSPRRPPAIAPVVSASLPRLTSAIRVSSSDVVCCIAHTAHVRLSIT